MIEFDAKAATPNSAHSEPDTHTEMHPREQALHNRIGFVEAFLEAHFPKEYVAFFGKDRI